MAVFKTIDRCCAQAGREGREKFGRREKRVNPNASTTNKEKRKTKNFMMLRHKAQKSKGKRSFQEKQVILPITRIAIVNRVSTPSGKSTKMSWIFFL